MHFVSIFKEQIGTASQFNIPKKGTTSGTYRVFIFKNSMRVGLHIEGNLA